MKVPNCHPERQRRVSRFFAEFILSEILQSLCSFRMTKSEGLRMTGWIAKISTNTAMEVNK